MQLQRLVRAIYPPQCVACDAQTEGDDGLCSVCWRQTHFIGGLTCDSCGVPLPGEDHEEAVQCDDCMVIARPWRHGRAVLAYSGVGRRLILGLKHGDRTDLARPAGRWMAQRVGPLVEPDTLLVPIPLHWVRIMRRKYNQAALLADGIGRTAQRPVCANALLRPRRTKPLEEHNRDARFAALDGAITANPQRTAIIAGRHVILVDDVMTSGATLAAGAEALKSAGAAQVDMVVLARVVKDA